MKKSCSCLLIFCIMFLFFFPNVVLANEAEETISLEELQNIFEVMNEMDNGDEVVVDNEWVVSCEKYVVQENTRSVYRDTKSEAAAFRITRLGSNVLAFMFKQTVTYIVNDEAETITIVDYDTDYTLYLSDLSVSTYREEYINNEASHHIAIAGAVYDVYSSIEGGFLRVYLDVVVNRAGLAEFTADVI